MVKTTFFSFTLSLLILCLATPLTANASRDGQTKRVKIRHDSNSLFPRHYYNIHFYRDATQSESKFTMRLASNGVVTGCAKMSDQKHEKKQVSDSIRLKVTDTLLRLNDRDPRYSNHDCEINSNESYTDIEFDRDELIADNIKKLELESERYGEFLSSEIDINKYRLNLITKTSNATHLITFWFFPENSVILHAPSAKRGQDIQNLIREYGISKGLVPMEDAIENYELLYSAKQSLFFTDPNGDIINRLNSSDKNTEIGHITPNRTVHGPNGPVDEPYDLGVFARLPAQNR